MKWLLQFTDRKSDDVVKEVHALEALGIKPLFFGLIRTGEDTDPSWEISGVCQEDVGAEPFIIRAGVRTIKIAESIQPWLALGTHYTRQQFDQAFYNGLGLPLFNREAVILSRIQFYNLDFDSPMFIKPTEDLKAFSAGCLNAGETAQEYIQRNRHHHDIDCNKVMVAPLRDPVDEVRFVVLDGEVIAGSYYVINGKRIDQEILSLNDGSEVCFLAKRYAKMYQPAQIFVMDLARVRSNSGYEIMEYNAFCASGLYAINLQQLFGRINDHFKQ